MWYVVCCVLYVLYVWYVVWCLRGPMDKASAYEAGDCGFESRRGLSLLLLLLLLPSLLLLLLLLLLLSRSRSLLPLPVGV
jgi:Ca2+/Na+ antiporter